MVNTRQKGTKMEGLCLKEFKEYMATRQDYKLIGEWRSVANRFQNVDVFDDWDVMLAYRYKTIQVWHAIQVKSLFKRSYHTKLSIKWADAPSHCWLSVYSKVPKHVQIYKRGEAQRIELPHFTLVRI